MRNGPEKPDKSDWLMDADTKAAELDLDEDRPLPTSRGVLTPAEIEALLRPKPQKTPLDAPVPVPQSIEPRVTPNFDVVAKSVDPEQNRKANVLASRLSIALGKGAGVKAAVTASEIAQVARADLPTLMQDKSCAIACVGPSETDIRALICFPPELADAIIAKACGARGSTGRIGDGWTLSAIDCALLEQLLVPLGEAVGSGMSLQAIETDVPYVCSLLPVSEVVISEFGIEAPGLRSQLAVVQAELVREPQTEVHSTQSQAPVTAVVTARLASLTVPLSRITELKAGSTLLLGLPGDQPIELLSGDRDGPVAFEGQMGRKGNKMAVKVTSRKRSFAKD